MSGLKQLLLLCFAAQLIGFSFQEDTQDDLIDELNELLNEGNEEYLKSQPKELKITPTVESIKCEKVNLTAEKDEFERRLLMLVTPIGQLSDQLKAALDESFSDIANRILNKATDPEPDDGPCGKDMECVEVFRCKNSTINDYGKYPITFRSAYPTTECSYDQKCCHISDKIEKPLENDEVQRYECGIRNPDGILLMIEGERDKEANYAEFPWMVAILNTVFPGEDDVKTNIGGGSLLSPNVVLTAAHKVHNIDENALWVRAGEWDIADTREYYSHQDLAVQQKIVHKDFIKEINNIALLVLEESFVLRPHIYPICLPSRNENFDHARCIVTGWGKRSVESKTYPFILKEISVPVVPRGVCTTKLQKVLGPRFRVHETCMCAGGEKDMDACLGDGGAPLVCPIAGKPNRYYQAGIVAWGFGCGKEDVPAGYSSVTYLMPWITQELRQLGVNSSYYTV